MVYRRSGKEGSIIPKPFKNLDREKQERILNAALKEFAQKGFELASTNRIVKDAQIGKGMLFYYFKSKKELYFYLLDHCMDTISNEYMPSIDMSERDFFQRMKDVSIVKISFLQNYPDAINFLTVALFQDVALLNEKQKAEIEAFQQKFTEMIYSNVDFTLFRKDLDPQKAFQLIRWTFQGYEEELKYRIFSEKEMGSINYTPYFDEFFTYLEVLRKAFYTNEEDAK